MQRCSKYTQLSKGAPDRPISQVVYHAILLFFSVWHAHPHMSCCTDRSIGASLLRVLQTSSIKLIPLTKSARAVPATRNLMHSRGGMEANHGRPNTRSAVSRPSLPNCKQPTVRSIHLQIYNNTFVSLVTFLFPSFPLMPASHRRNMMLVSTLSLEGFLDIYCSKEKVRFIGFC